MSKTILLIDDDHSLLDLFTLKFSLEKSLWLLTADTPEKGIDLAASAKPQLILLDLILPKREGLLPDLDKETGFATLRALKSNAATKDIPVVIFTNLDEQAPDNVDRARSLGAMDYWVKVKLQPAEVVERVKKIVS